MANNAASPILDYAKGVYDKIESVTGDPSKKKGQAAQKPVDTSWHDDEVKRANDSFKVSANSPSAKTAQGKPAPRKKAQAKRY